MTKKKAGKGDDARTGASYLKQLNRGVDISTLFDDPKTGIVMRRDMWEALESLREKGE